VSVLGRHLNLKTKQNQGELAIQIGVGFDRRLRQIREWPVSLTELKKSICRIQAEKRRRKYTSLPF